MNCPACHFDNPSEMRLCGKCGAKLGAGTPDVAAGFKPASRTLEPEKEEHHLGRSFREEVIEMLEKARAVYDPKYLQIPSGWNGDQQGRRDAARTLLAEIHGCFTEGLDTHDLIEAKALLEELGG